MIRSTKLYDFDIFPGDKYPTICHVIPKLYMLRCQMFSVKTVQTQERRYAPVRQMVEHMYDDLTTRFPLDGCNVDVYALGVVVYKGILFDRFGATLVTWSVQSEMTTEG